MPVLEPTGVDWAAQPELRFVERERDGRPPLRILQQRWRRAGQETVWRDVAFVKGTAHE